MLDEMLVCPYNESHVIVRHRMPYHLVKCKKNHQENGTLQACPFNAMHVVRKVDIRQHIESCPDYRRQHL
uniref:CHHC U11-48K-type domain-containing protein n=1 Tax=Anopheles epiroticus TaxID=199890 RepID=A0A182P4A1_9DIPT